jgi:hypothetical protein
VPGAEVPLTVKSFTQSVIKSPSVGVVIVGGHTIVIVTVFESVDNALPSFA